MEKILVTGATGILGSAVINTFLKSISPNRIATLTRKEEKQQEFQLKGFDAHLGDYNDVAALQNAMKDVDTVLLISAGDQGDRMQEHRNVIDAAKKTGVTSIAYTSRSLRDRDSLANKLMSEHFETEDYIKQSGLKYTIFQNALYMDVIPLFVGKQVFESGIFQPAGDGKVAFALRSDMGEAMANVLSNEPLGNNIYRFTGSIAYSFYDVATALSQLSGREVKYTPVTIPVFETLMKQKGLPDGVIKKITDFNLDINNGQESMVTNELEIKLGRKPVSLKDGLKELFGL